jgi:hypothetical protein
MIAWHWRKLKQRQPVHGRGRPVQQRRDQPPARPAARVRELASEKAPQRLILRPCRCGSACRALRRLPRAGAGRCCGQ